MILPEITLDPWNILSLKKILTLISAITFMQLLSIQLMKVMGPKRGAVLTGLLSGLISSTATVVATAKMSKELPSAVVSQILIYISSTIAMQIVALAIVLLGTEGIHYNLIVVILFPVIGAAGMIIFETRKNEKQFPIVKEAKFEFSHILKLTLLIVLTFYASKISEMYLKGSSQYLLTFLVSLFEMHGSIIVNLQLHDAGAMSVTQLGTLIAVSILASFTSKLFFVLSLGSRELKMKVIFYSAVSFLLTASGWDIFFWNMK